MISKNLSRNTNGLVKKTETKEKRLTNYNMNEELIKIINFIIENGKVECQAIQGLATDNLLWRYDTGDYELWFNATLYFDDAEANMVLALDDDIKLIIQAQMYPVFEVKKAKNLIDEINKLELIP